MSNGTETHRRVLLVEDDEDIRDLLSRLIHSYGCEAVHATTHEEVDDALAAGPVALALLDIMLPGVDGRELARRLRGEGRTFPVYFVTGMHSLIREADRENVDGVLHKPFTVAELRDLLDRTVGRRAPEPAPQAPPDAAGSGQRRSLELMTAIAAQQEALRRQEAHLESLARAVAQPDADEIDRKALANLAARHKDSLQSLGNLLEEVRGMLQN